MNSKMKMTLLFAILGVLLTSCNKGTHIELDKTTLSSDVLVDISTEK